MSGDCPAGTENVTSVVKFWPADKNPNDGVDRVTVQVGHFNAKSPLAINQLTVISDTPSFPVAPIVRVPIFVVEL